jgi:hypothetical protein
MVQRALRISELNVQKQLDEPFLVTSSAGEVAKTINRITRLEMVDNWVSDLTSKINSINREKERLEAEIEASKNKIKSYRVLVSLQPILDRAKEIDERLDKLNELNEYLIKKGIILQILSYYNSYDSSLLKFAKNSFVIINHNEIRYSNIFSFVNNTKLRICDDINITDDQHPNFKAHEIVANSVYQNILKHPLYTTI